MFQAYMYHATHALNHSDPHSALDYLRLALPLAAKGRQWSMTMTAIRHTLRAINHA